MQSAIIFLLSLTGLVCYQSSILGLIFLPFPGICVESSAFVGLLVHQVSPALSMLYTYG